MQIAPQTFIQSLTGRGTWLVILASSLVLFHLEAVWKLSNGDTEALVTYVLFLGSIGSLLWAKRASLQLESSAVASVVGATLLALVLLKGSSFYNVFAQISPLVSALGLALIASGRHLKQYALEFLLVATLVSTPLFEWLFSQHLQTISTLSAKYAYLILWYTGFSVVSIGSKIILPTGSVDVYIACSGFQSMLQLFKISILFLAMFPTAGWWRKLVLPLAAVATAFLVNGFRVALMAILNASDDPFAFKYWHNGDGSNIFSMIAMLLFAALAYTQIQPELEPEAELATEPEPIEVEVLESQER